MDQRRSDIDKKAWANNSTRRETISKKMKAQWQDLKFRAKATAKISEINKHNASKLKAKWADPDHYAKMCAARKKQATPEHNQANSERLKAKWNDPEYRAKMIAARKSSYTPEKSAKIHATRKKNGCQPWNKGHTKDTHPTLAAASAKFMGKIPNYKKMRCWYRGPKKRKVYMRSKWEVAFAHYLDRQGIEWEYEPRFFNVGKGPWNGMAYVPDFYLPKKKEYIELKGRLSQSCLNKLRAFRQQYPKVKWRMFGVKALYQLGVVDIHGCAIL